MKIGVVVGCCSFFCFSFIYYGEHWVRFILDIIKIIQALAMFFFLLCYVVVFHGHSSLQNAFLIMVLRYINMSLDNG